MNSGHVELPSSRLKRSGLMKAIAAWVIGELRLVSGTKGCCLLAIPNVRRKTVEEYGFGFGTKGLTL